MARRILSPNFSPPRLGLLAIASTLLWLAPLNSTTAQDDTQPVRERAGQVHNAADVITLGEKIYGALVPIIEARLTADEDSPCAPQEGVPQCFDIEIARRVAVTPVAAQAARNGRLTALLVIEGYAALVQAVGRGEVAPAQAEASRLHPILQTVIGNSAAAEFGRELIDNAIPVPRALTDAGFGIIAGLMTRIAEHQDAEQQSQALIDGSVVVNSMITGLIEETPRIYEIYRLSRNEEIIDLEGKERIAELRLAEIREADERAAEIEGAEESLANIREQLEQTRGDVREFHGSLGSFVTLLDRRRAAIAILVAASTHVEVPPPTAPEHNSIRPSAVDEVRRSAGLLALFKRIVAADFSN